MVYQQLKAIRALMLFKEIPLGNRRALSLYKVYGITILLVLNRTLFNVNPFSTGTGWTLHKVYGDFRISYGTG